MFTLRVARPTDNLPEVVEFYRDGLGLEVLSSFSGHKDFDGVILGRKGSPYHLEFTPSNPLWPEKEDNTSSPKPSPIEPDDLRQIVCRPGYAQ